MNKLVFVLPSSNVNPSNVSKVATLIETQSGTSLEDLLEHNEVLHVKFLDDHGTLNDEFYKADDWFGQVDLIHITNN